MIAETAIRNMGIFAGVPSADHARLAAVGEIRSAEAGEYLFRLGATANELFLIESGEVSLTIPLEVLGVQKEVAFETVGPGHTLAWSALVRPHLLTLSARANRESRCIVFRTETLEPLLEAHPGIALIFYKNLTELVAHRLHRIQTMWIRELQRGIKEKHG